MPALTHLDQLEAEIEQDLGAFVRVGRNLAEIRDEELYRERGCASFNEYVTKKWEPAISSRRARQLIIAAETVQIVTMGNMFPIVSPPTNARQAAELAPLAKTDPEAAVELWAAVQETAAASDRPVTAADVREAVREYQEKPGLHIVRDSDETPEEPDDAANDGERFTQAPNVREAVLRAAWAKGKSLAYSNLFLLNYESVAEVLSGDLTDTRLFIEQGIDWLTGLRGALDRPLRSVK